VEVNIFRKMYSSMFLQETFIFIYISGYLFAIFISFYRMTIQEAGLSDVVLDSLAQCIGRGPGEITVVVKLHYACYSSYIYYTPL